jgi:hypothetical protein
MNARFFPNCNAHSFRLTNEVTCRPFFGSVNLVPHLKSARIKLFFCAVNWLLALLILPLHAQSVVNISIPPQTPGPAIASDFSGLSFEMQYVLPDTNGNHFFSATNKRLIATFKTLGIKNLRVGGNTAERPTVSIPNEADVDSLFAFARAADVKIIYTLRLNHGEIEAAVKMANYISRKYKNELDCFAIGNEPNVFSTNYDVYIAEWKRFAAQITASTNSPDAKFCGPGVSPGHEKWSARFANDLASGGQIKFVSQHDYPGGDARKFAANAFAAREKILSPAIENSYAKFAANFVPTVQSNGLAFRFEEANSFYDGGALDASDTFASALWALDYQWWWAAHGAGGINFHTGDKVAARDENKPCRYATFWTTANGYNVHPIGYAEKMFSLGGHGKLLTATVENTNNFNLSVYATTAAEENIFITLINKEHGDSARAADIVLDLGFAKARAEIIFLTAPNGDVAAKTGVTLGGAEIQDDATWNGKWTDLPKPAADGKFSLKLPAASAALVKITTE